MVIGGGPAGIQADLTAAQREHTVSLHEKSPALGDLLRVAALPPHKSEYTELTHYYEHALPKAGVAVHLSSLSAAEVAKQGTDSILVCTGNGPVEPEFCKNTPNLHAQDVLCGAPVGQRILILGGGLVGSECAAFLSEQGKDVTVLEMREGLALDMESRTRRLFMPQLKNLGVKSLLQCQVQSISPHEQVNILNPLKSKQVLNPFDSIILALGYKSENTLYEELLTLDLPVKAVGDCYQPGKVMQAVWHAFETAYSL